MAVVAKTVNVGYSLSLRWLEQRELAGVATVTDNEEVELTETLGESNNHLVHIPVSQNHTLIDYAL